MTGIGGLGNNLNAEIALNQMNQRNNQPFDKLKAAAEGDEHQAASESGGLLQTFGDIIQQQMDELNRLQANADEAVQTYSVGGPVELHDVIMSVEKANISLELATQVRNKLVSAYQEISRMQV
ncbi:MAG: flagellar hook-basal body complex protein FliE [Vampirovibrio sp.]|nr:flagellar hook-basal body complex protein FliE [Vampirovibrio sp.]